MFKDKYNIKISNFEGPMDLLLYFINRDRVDIYDIPIFQITDDYLKYMDMMKEMDIDLGAEFVYMSTLLIQIKARMLLPKAIGEDEENIEDPRAELVHRILEYKRYKNASNDLEIQLDKHSKKYPKGMAMSYTLSEDVSPIIPKDIRVFDLAITFKNILDNLPENNELDLYAEEISLNDQIEYINDILQTKKTFYLMKTVPENSGKIYLITLFLAILELIRTGKIQCKQTKNFSDIIVSRQS